MQFLTGVRITDFRSIAHSETSGLGDLVPIVGPNGSGKSNFLRCLNLFFNDQIESDYRLDLRRDFREPGRKAKLRVSVEVDLDFGVFDALRDEYRESLDRLAEGEDIATLRKEWTLHPVTKDQVLTVWAGPDSESLAELDTDLVPYATRLLNLIRFRYIPNHVHPSEVLSAEEANIRSVLFARLGPSGALSERAVKQIAREAEDMMVPIAHALGEATGDIGKVELATPKDWRELAWTFGLRLQASQTQAFEARLHGSGVQSVLAYQVLHLLDTTFLRSFGWRKGAVWAIEEPESFLHAKLQGELAKAFSAYGTDEPAQIFLTTHSPAFLGAAQQGMEVTLDSSGRSAFHQQPRQELIRVAYRAGAAPFAHPLHTGPPRPMLLVEGEDDRDLITRAYQESEFPNPYEVLCLHDFDGSMSGGDETPKWLKYHREALEARPVSSPIIVLLDWEAKDALVSSIDKVLKGHPSSRCIRWPEDLMNQELSPNWVGIERLFSTRFVEDMRDELGLPILLRAKRKSAPWKYSIDKKDLEQAKSRLHFELDQRLDPGDIAPLIAALPWLSQQLKDAPTLL